MFRKKCSEYGANDPYKQYDGFEQYSKDRLLQMRDDLTAVKIDEYFYDASGYHYIRTTRLNALCDFYNSDGIVDKQKYSGIAFEVGDTVLTDDYVGKAIISSVPGELYSSPMWSDQYEITDLNGGYIPDEYNASQLTLINKGGK